MASLRARGTATTLILAAAAAAPADTFIDFENLAAGTVVTNQYEGVTISAPPNSCSGSPPVNAVIAVPAGGTSSGTRGLTVTTGCPDFSPDYLRLVFAEPHGEVAFTLGDSPGTYNIRAYNVPAGGAPIINMNVNIAGAEFVGVFRYVRLRRAGNDIRRVEIQDTISDFEFIDDLFFDCTDATAPIAEIDDPATLDCVCNLHPVLGSAYDAEDGLAYWRLYRKAPTAAAWTLIASSTNSEVIDDQLAIWNTTAPAGYYYLRLVVENDCGAISETQTLVYLDKAPPSLTLRRPDNGDIRGGEICIDGTAVDNCPGTLAVEWRTAGAGVYAPVTNVAAAWVTTDPLGTWVTPNAVPDGNYDIRVRATDDCGNTSSLTRTITVDNTPPVAAIASPLDCEYVAGVVPIFGTASDAHLGSWSLQYTGGDAPGWVEIAAGGAGVVGGLLAEWDTTGLRPCAYTLRLVATDRSVLDCSGGLLRNQAEALVSVNIGSPCDVNHDGSADFFDVDPFIECLFGG